MVNFQIIYPNFLSEDIGTADMCVEQKNGELNDEVKVKVQTSWTGSTATGTYVCVC